MPTTTITNYRVNSSQLVRKRPVSLGGTGFLHKYI